MADSANCKEQGMGCILLAYGEDLNVDDLMSKIGLTPLHVDRKGEPRFGPSSKKIAKRSGLRFSTSEASEKDLDEQIRDTVSFLETHANDIRTITAFPGVEDAYLDFSNECRLDANVIGQNDFFPKELVALAGQLGLGINLTTYSRPN
jgi:hypothetical protein